MCMCVCFVVHYCKFHPSGQTAIHQALPRDRRQTRQSVIQTKLHKLPHPPQIFFFSQSFFLVEENKRKRFPQNAHNEASTHIQWVSVRQTFVFEPWKEWKWLTDTGGAILPFLFRLEKKNAILMVVKTRSVSVKGKRSALYLHKIWKQYENQWATCDGTNKRTFNKKQKQKQE